MKTILVFSLITILFSYVYVNAQDLKITGKVAASNGSVLPSTLIVLKSNAMYHTRSDKNGKYVLNVPPIEKDTLLFLYIGYENREIAIHNQQTIDVSLTEQPLIKNKEVVAIAYGAIEKERQDPVKIPNAYNGDNSIEIPNAYDRDKDISIEIPNADLKGKKTTIRKLVPELLPNP